MFIPYDEAYVKELHLPPEKVYCPGVALLSFLRKNFDFGDQLEEVYLGWLKELQMNDLGYIRISDICENFGIVYKNFMHHESMWLFFNDEEVEDPFAE